MKRNKFYDSKRWDKARQRVLKRDNYIDMEAKRYGKLKPATVVHHILPRGEYPEYELADWNLISLSKETHNAMHDRNSDELSQKGIDLLIRTCNRNFIPIPDKYKQLEKKKNNRKGRGFKGLPPQALRG